MTPCQARARTARASSRLRPGLAPTPPYPRVAHAFPTQITSSVSGTLSWAPSFGFRNLITLKSRNNSGLPDGPGMDNSGAGSDKLN